MEQKKGSLKLGGCAIAEDGPHDYCNDCKNQWTSQDAIDHANNEIIGVKALVGGYFEGYYKVTIDFNTRELTWNHRLPNESITKQVSSPTVENFKRDLQMLSLLK